MIVPGHDWWIFIDCGRLDQNAWCLASGLRGVNWSVPILFVFSYDCVRVGYAFNREYCEKRCALDSIVSRYAAWAWEEAKMPST